VVDPDQAYDAARYLKDARAVVDDCRRRGATPLAVGGTGLYLRSLLMGLFDGPPQDEGFRNQLQKEARRLGRRRLHQRLDQVDPKAAARIHENDLVRIIRALEVHHLTGRPISEYQADHSLADRPFDVLFFCLTRPRDELNRRIERRTQAMIEAGWAAEVEGLLNRGYHRDLKPMKAIGYRELVRYVQGDWPLPRARDEIIKRTRQYAKRQMTWHRSQEGVIMVDVNQTDRVIDRAEAFIESNPEAAA
jgi:tRNA dimethylallyltransferase